MHDRRSASICGGEIDDKGIWLESEAQAITPWFVVHPTMSTDVGQEQAITTTRG
jgi:hypothetical protein